MSGPRVPLLPVKEALAAAEKQEIPAAIAELNVFRVFLNHPALAKRVCDLLLTLLFNSKLDARLRELVIMRLGWTTASNYEWTQHWRVALQLGVSEEDLLAVRDWRNEERFGPPERAVMAAVDETLEQGAISPETWAACREHVGEDAELLELVAAIGTWRMISSMLRSLEVPLEEGVESWPPDGRTP